MPGEELVVAKTKAMVKREDAQLPTVFVTYDRDTYAGYTFSKEFDQQRSVQLSFSVREYEESVFVDEEFDETVKDAHKDYYRVAAACGLLTATLSQVRLSDLFELKDKLEEKHVEKYIVMAAKVAGYKKGDYKGSVQFILKKAVPFVSGHMPPQLLHYFSSLSSNPRLAGLVFSIITQFTGEKYQVNEKGKILKYPVPDYYAIGRYPAEKILFGLLYWVFALAAHTAVSKKSVLVDLGIPKDLLKVLKDYVNVPLLKNIPNDVNGAERQFSAWIGKLFEESEIVDVDGNRYAFDLIQLIRDTALEAIEASVPVVINECLFRGFYFLKRLGLELKAKKLSSFAELDGLDPHDILPFNNQVVSRMAVIASGTFLGADLACAAVRVLMSTKGKGKDKDKDKDKDEDKNIADLAKAMRAEINIAGVCRFVLALGADSKYWVEDIKVLFVRKQKNTGIDYEEVIGGDSEASAVFSTLSLEAVQARLMYSFEYQAVLEDIFKTKDSETKEKKKLWLREWQSQIVKGMNYQDNDFFSTSLQELHSYLAEQRKLEENHHWIYLMSMELALFEAYQPLGVKEDAAFRKLKFDSEAVEAVYLNRQGFVKISEWKKIKSDYKSHYGIISGNTKNLFLGIGIPVVLMALTGGLASLLAPQIAVVLAGEAVVGLHGAALTSASLAFVGGGAVAAGGGGMAAGAAIITGGGALLGAASSGSVSMIALMTQANPGLWARQGAKLATFCSAVLNDLLHEDGAIRSILTGTEEAGESVQKMIDGIKEDETVLDKEFLKFLEKYLLYIERTGKEISRELK